MGIGAVRGRVSDSRGSVWLLQTSGWLPKAPLGFSKLHLAPASPSQLNFPSNFRCSASIKSPQWYCRDEKCLTTKFHPTYSQSTDYTINETSFNSIGQCRLFCHEFGALWPLPVKARLSKTPVRLSPSKIRTIFTADDGINVLLSQFFDIFMGQVRGECGDDCEQSFGDGAMIVRFAVSSLDTGLGPSTKENYGVVGYTVDGQLIVTISADSVFGVRHGLETLAQLIVSCMEFDENGDKM